MQGAIPDCAKGYEMEYEVLKRCIEKVLHVYSKEISVSVEFATELGADSIDMAQIFGCVEEELGIKLDIIDMSSIVTVGDALKIIKQACQTSARKNEA